MSDATEDAAPLHVTATSSGGQAVAIYKAETVVINPPQQPHELCVACIETQDPRVVAWNGPLPHTFVRHAWGPPGTAHGQRVRVRFEPLFRSQQSLAEALVRLAIHGGVSAFETQEPAEWPGRCALVAGRCLGCHDPLWKPGTPGGWVISEFPAEQNPQGANTPGDELANDLQRHMDGWVFARLKVLFDQLFHGERTIEIAFHPEYLAAMKQTWATWCGFLEEDPELLAHFLGCVLIRPEGEQVATGRTRAGPRTLERLLEPAIGLALALEAALAEDMKPRVAAAPAHLSVKEQFAHLFGLKLIAGKLITLSLHSQQWATDYVFIAHTDAPPDRLRDHGSFVRSSDPLASLTRPTNAATRLVTKDPEVVRLISDEPPPVLGRHLRELFRQQGDEYRRRAESVMNTART